MITFNYKNKRSVKQNWLSLGDNHVLELDSWSAQRREVFTKNYLVFHSSQWHKYQIHPDVQEGLTELKTL